MILNEGQAVRFVFPDVLIDTRTCEKLAVSRGHSTRSGDHGPEQVRFENLLVRHPETRRLFVVEHRTTKFLSGKPLVEDRARPVQPAEAVAWIAAEGAAIFDSADVSDLPLPQ